MQKLQSAIEQAWEDRARLAPGSVPAKIGKAVAHVIDALDAGRLRVAEKLDGTWQTHQWIKKAVLLSFRIEDNRPVRAGPLQFYDKVRTKFERYDRKQFQRGGFRVVPPAVARRGAYIAKNVVLMPSYINVGAYVDEGTMVDTWATVGSCAQIGKNVHLSGGVGIGGVLEPLQANPTIVEDNCFIGARSEIVEGVIVEENAVISMPGMALRARSPRTFVEYQPTYRTKCSNRSGIWRQSNSSHCAPGIVGTEALERNSELPRTQRHPRQVADRSRRLDQRAPVAPGQLRQIAVLEVRERLEAFRRLKGLAEEQARRCKPAAQRYAGALHRGDVLVVFLFRALNDDLKLVRHEVVERRDLRHAIAREQRVADAPEVQAAEKRDLHAGCKHDQRVL